MYTILYTYIWVNTLVLTGNWTTLKNDKTVIKEEKFVNGKALHTRRYKPRIKFK